MQASNRARVQPNILAFGTRRSSGTDLQWFVFLLCNKASCKHSVTSPARKPRYLTIPQYDSLHADT